MLGIRQSCIIKHSSHTISLIICTVVNNLRDRCQPSDIVEAITKARIDMVEAVTNTVILIIVVAFVHRNHWGLSQTSIRS